MAPVATLTVSGILNNKIIKTMDGMRIPLINVSSYGIEDQTGKVYIYVSDGRQFYISSSREDLVARLDQCFIDYIK